MTPEMRTPRQHFVRLVNQQEKPASKVEIETGGETDNNGTRGRFAKRAFFE